MQNSSRIPALCASLLVVTLLCGPLVCGTSQASEKLSSQAAKRRAPNKAAVPARHRHRKKTSSGVQVAVPGQESGDRDETEEVEAREQWFSFERRYPFDSIPENARRRAWESRPQGHLTPQAEQRWNPVGPNPTTPAFPDNWGMTSGRINTIAISPTDPRIVLIGSATGGIWRSGDGGAKFVPVSDDQVDLAVGSIVFSPSNPSMVYAGMGDAQGGYLGSGVLKSTDSGQSWKRVSNDTLPGRGRISKVAIDPANPNRVYVAQFSYLQVSENTIYASGFYFSTDGGVNWKKTFSGLARDVVVNPAKPQTLYLGMNRVDEAGGTLPAGLYQSTNGGESWTNSYPLPFTSTFDVRVAVSAENPQKVYLYTGGNTGSGSDYRLIVSTDGGQTWTSGRVVGLLDTGQFGYNTYIETDPQNSTTVYVGTRDVFKSTDSGITWVNLTNNFRLSGAYNPYASNSHPDQHSFTFSPVNSQEILIGNDGGISKSTDGGNTFVSLNQSLSLTMFVSLALHPTDPLIAYGGTQDNGTQRRLSGPKQWAEFSAGDGGKCVINPLDPSIVFTTYIYGKINRFQNNGGRYDKAVGTNTIFGESDSNPRIAFYPPLVGNGVDDTLYFGTWRLFVSKNRGASWSAPAGTLDLTKGITSSGPDVLNAIGVASSNPKVIYTGSRQGRAMITNDGGQNWTDITASLPNRTIKSLTVSRTNPAVAYLTVSGSSSGHAFKTVNSGQSWTDISGNLPNIPANALLIDPTNDKLLYVGTDIGVFRSTMDGTVWETFNTGLPPIIVTAFASQAGGIIQMATYGRGAYELRNTPVDTTPPVVKVLSPNGGEVFKNGNVLSIRWTSSDDTAVAVQSIALSIDSGKTFPFGIVTGLPGTSQSYNWSLPGTAPRSSTVRIRVSATDQEFNTGTGMSANDFTLVGLATPANLKATVAGKEVQLAWDAPSDSQSLTNYAIYRSTTSPVQTSFDMLIARISARTTTYTDSPEVADGHTTYYYVVTAFYELANQSSRSNEVSATLGGPNGNDQKPPTVKVLSPNGGEKLIAGSTFRITWQSADNVGVVSHEIHLSTNGGATFGPRIATGLSGSAQSFDFVVLALKTKAGRVRVIARDAAGNEGKDDSDANFRIKVRK